MNAVLVVLHIVVVLLLLMVLAIRPARSRLSSFELERRAKSGDKQAKADRRREAVIPDVLSLQRAIGAVLFVTTSFIGIGAYGWTIGVIVAIVVALEAAAVSHLGFVHRAVRPLYEAIEPSLIRFITKYPWALRPLRSTSPMSATPAVHSKEELAYLIEEAGEVLGDDERAAITAGLAFGGRTVKDVMTPRSMIDAIAKGEVLGPVTLDDLHKKGHSRMPVYEKDLDHVVGILYARDLLVIDGSRRHSRTAGQAMDARVYYIKEDQTLDQALAAFLKCHHHLFIVVNEFRETVGLLTLEDVIEQLLGRTIADEFDTHDNVRAVASRNPRQNNSPAESIDV